MNFFASNVLEVTSVIARRLLNGVIALSFLAFLPVAHSQPTQTQRVAAGLGHTLIVNHDGTVWAFGQNNAGQLGIGATPTTQPVPTLVKGVNGSGHLEDIVSVATCHSHSLALRSDGTVWAFGTNSQGQLGNNTQAASQTTPVQVLGPDGIGFLDNIIAIAAGQSHSLALKNDGAVWSFGYNQSGQLGDNTTTVRRTTPVQVVGENGTGFLDNVIAIAAGTVHSLALKSNGTVWTFGSNTYGSLGIGTSSGISRFPVRVRAENGVDYLTNIVSIAAGQNHSLVVKSDGSVWAFGAGSQGQLGITTPNGTAVSRTYPKTSLS